MRLEDVALVAAIDKIVNPSPWSETQIRAELSNPGSSFDLLFVAGELAAYLCSWQIVDELQIQNVATAPDFQRSGYAAQLLRHVLHRAAQEDVVTFFLEVRAGNVAARSLYEKFQFTVSGVRPKYYADDEDALLMNLVIQNDHDESD